MLNICHFDLFQDFLKLHTNVQRFKTKTIFTHLCDEKIFCAKTHSNHASQL